MEGDADAHNSVPVIDFSAYSLERDSPDPERIQQLVDDVHKALTTIGFMYLENFGIPAKKIQDAFDYSKKFFYLPLEQKMKSVRPDKSNHGYIQLEREGLNPDRPFKDLKEAFNYTPASAERPFPDNEVPEFRGAITDLFSATMPLHQRVLDIMAMGLKLEDPQYFSKRHCKMGTSESTSTVRTLFYPSISSVTVKEDQVRCGEHSDYGAITLLYQDSNGGLEVRNMHGEWVPAPPIEGTVVVNIGDLMQQWTADKLIASKHRVMIPLDQIKREVERQSIAFFGHPDTGVMIECIDGSNKYKPVESVDYLNMRFNATYSPLAT